MNKLNLLVIKIGLEQKHAIILNRFYIMFGTLLILTLMISLKLSEFIAENNHSIYAISIMSGLVILTIVVIIIAIQSFYKAAEEKEKIKQFNNLYSRNKTTEEIIEQLEILTKEE